MSGCAELASIYGWLLPAFTPLPQAPMLACAGLERPQKPWYHAHSNAYIPTMSARRASRGMCVPEGVFPIRVRGAKHQGFWLASGQGTGVHPKASRTAGHRSHGKWL